MGTLLQAKDDPKDLTDSIFNLAKQKSMEENIDEESEKKEVKKQYFMGEGKKLGVSDIKIEDKENKEIKPILTKKKELEEIKVSFKIKQRKP
jgi:hypothetical protein